MSKTKSKTRATKSRNAAAKRRAKPRPPKPPKARPPKSIAPRPATPAPAESAPTAAATATASDCPYRPGTLYGTLFVEGNGDYIHKAELISKVAAKTGKSEKVVGFAFQVLKSPSHRSNGGRSTMITEGDRVKLVAVHRRQ